MLGGSAERIYFWGVYNSNGYEALTSPNGATFSFKPTGGGTTLFAELQVTMGGETTINRRWENGQMVDDSAFFEIPPQTIDLDVDSNNDGQITDADDPIEDDPQLLGSLLRNIGNDLPLSCSTGGMDGCTVLLSATEGGEHIVVKNYNGDVVSLPAVMSASSRTFRVYAVSIGPARLTASLRDSTGAEIATDSVRVRAIGVDLRSDVNGDGVVDDNDDPNEGEGLGRLVAYNWDDDNGNGTRDLEDADHPVADEDNLAAVSLTVGPGVPDGCKIYLYDDAYTTIRAWTTPTKDEQITPDRNQPFHVVGQGEMRTSLYIEGRSTSGILHTTPLRMKLEDENGFTLDTDELRFTTVQLTPRAAGAGATVTARIINTHSDVVWGNLGEIDFGDAVSVTARPSDTEVELLIAHDAPPGKRDVTIAPGQKVKNLFHVVMVDLAADIDGDGDIDLSGDTIRIKCLMTSHECVSMTEMRMMSPDSSLTITPRRALPTSARSRPSMTCPCSSAWSSRSAYRSQACMRRTCRTSTSPAET